MRDVIVIGAGGGGPVVAKELAARGLDVLLLEGGSRFAKPEVEWTPASFMSTSVAFRWGPLDPTKPPYYTQLDGSRVSREAGGSVAGVGGMTLHYWAGNPRAVPGVFTGYAGADAEGYDVAHRFPFSYEHLRPYYEWVEKTLPVATSPVDRKAEVFIAGALAVGLPVNPRKDVGEASFRPQENAILQPGGAAGLRTVARAAATNALA